MKIGYIRFNNKVELKFEDASSRSKGTERRLGILEALSKNHEITILSPVKKFEIPKNNVSSFLGFDVDKIDYSFLNKIKFDLESEEPDVDCLIVENGATNTMFSYRSDKYLKKFDDGNVPCLFRTFDLLRNFKGNVFFLQWDTSLYFATGEHIGRTEENLNSLSERNLGRLSHYANIEKNKKFKLITTCDPLKLIDKFKNAKRPNYKLFDETVHIPICYSDNIDRKLKPRENPEFDLTYVGTYDKYRESNIKRLSNDKIKFRLIGRKWKWDEYKEDINIIHKQHNDNHIDVYNYYNNSFCGLQTPNYDDNMTGNMTSRLVQIIRGGAIPLLYGYNEKMQEEYQLENKLIRNREELNHMIDFVKKMDYDERVAFNEYCNTFLNQWKDLDWDSILEIK